MAFQFVFVSPMLAGNDVLITDVYIVKQYGSIDYWSNKRCVASVLVTLPA